MERVETKLGAITEYPTVWICVFLCGIISFISADTLWCTLGRTDRYQKGRKWLDLTCHSTGVVQVTSWGWRLLWWLFSVDTWSGLQYTNQQELWPGKWTDKDLRLLLGTRCCKSQSKQSSFPHHIRRRFSPQEPVKALCSYGLPNLLGLFRGTIFFRSQRRPPMFPEAKQNQNQSRHVLVIFPALWASYR